MRCSQFLDLYSDYRDGLITDPRVEADIRMHLMQCKRCMDYDATISRGVMALRATSDINPSRSIHGDFRRHQREYQDEFPDSEGVRTAHAGIMAGLMTVAAVVLFLGVGAAPEEEPSAPLAAASSSAPPFLTVRDGLRAVDLTDSNVPAYGRELPADSAPHVSFDRWISLTH
jgi:hypothetical protein